MYSSCHMHKILPVCMEYATATNMFCITFHIQFCSLMCNLYVKVDITIFMVPAYNLAPNVSCFFFCPTREGVFVIGYKKGNVTTKPQYWLIDRNFGAKCANILLTLVKFHHDLKYFSSLMYCMLQFI